MKYRWTRCPKCGCDLSINYSDSPRGVAGSVRRWSADRSINDGRPIRVASAEVSSDGGFGIACICGQPIAVPARPDAVAAEREGNLRVNLGEE